MQKKLKKIKLGVIGAGNFFLKRYFEEIKKEKRVELTCLCRTNKKNLIKIGNITNVKNLYINSKKMLENEKLDFVLITSPHSKHFQHIKQAFENNTNVLVEKPLVINILEKNKIKKIINKSKKKIISIYNPPYESHFNEVREYVNSNNFGKLEYVNIFWSDNKKNLYYKNKSSNFNNISSKNFRISNNNTDGSILFDSTDHLIAELLWISKKLPISVFAKSDKNIKPLKINMCFNFEDNLFANIFIVANSKLKKRKFESSYWSEKKKITINGKPEKIIIEDFHKKTVTIKKKFHSVRNPITEMVDYLANKQKPKLDINTSFKIISILSTIEKSFQKNKLVKIKY